MACTEHLYGRARHHDRATRKAAGARAGAGEGRWYCLTTIALADSLLVRMGVFVPALRACEPPKGCLSVQYVYDVSVHVVLCCPTTMVWLGYLCASTVPAKNTTSCEECVPPELTTLEYHFHM
jgi:hypothetical protein